MSSYQEVPEDVPDEPTPTPEWQKSHEEVTKILNGLKPKRLAPEDKMAE